MTNTNIDREVEAFKDRFGTRPWTTGDKVEAATLDQWFELRNSRIKDFLRASYARIAAASKEEAKEAAKTMYAEGIQTGRADAIAVVREGSAAMRINPILVDMTEWERGFNKAVEIFNKLLPTNKDI